MSKALPPIVDDQTWRVALDKLREREKAATRELGAIAAQRRRLPMVELPDYTLIGADGAIRLVDMFDGRSQLIVYHHMWSRGADWQCSGCTGFTSQFTRLEFLNNYIFWLAGLARDRRRLRTKGQRMTKSLERYVVTRTIAASPTEIFAVLADPSRHRSTEPGDWVRDAADATPITHTGQLFAMNMYLTQAGGDYVMHNLVNVFDADRAIGWIPGQLDNAGNHAAGGWSWRYDLAPSGNHTAVTLTYDWSGTSQDFRDKVGKMPPFGEDYISASLVTLERFVAG